jgi:site-specific recombinase XerD
LSHSIAAETLCEHPPTVAILTFPDSQQATCLVEESSATGLLSHYINEYLSDCYGLSERTQKLYATHLNRLLETVGDLPITEVDAKILRGFMSGLRRRDGRKYSAAYLDQVYRTLHTFFEWLIKERVLAINPLTQVRRVKVPKRKSPRLKLSELERVIEAAGETQHAERNVAMIYLMAGSGLRRGEVLNLRLSELDLENGAVRVFGKDKEEREIPMGEETVEALQAYLHVRPTSNSEKVFLKEDGEPLEEDGIQSMMYRLKVKTGLPRLYCHLLRHTFANHYVAGGGSLRKLQKILGHSNIRTTAEIYTDPELRELQEEHARVSPLAQLRDSEG